MKRIQFITGLVAWIMLLGVIPSAVSGSTSLFNGIEAGKTTWDWQQYSSARQIQTGFAFLDQNRRYVHVTWTVQKIYEVNDPNRSIHYDLYDWNTPRWLFTIDEFGGFPLIEEGERGGYTTIDANSMGYAVVMHHSEAEGVEAYPRVCRFNPPMLGRLGIYSVFRLSNLPDEENVMLRGACEYDQGGSWPADGDYHIAGRDDQPIPGIPAHLVYWRYSWDEGLGQNIWEGPVLVDSNLTISHQIFADGDRVIYAFAKPRDYSSHWQDNDLVYYESNQAGADWIANGGPSVNWENGGGYNVTDCVEADSTRCFVDITGGFDSEGRLHMVFNTSDLNSYGAPHPNNTVLYHWDEGTPGSNSKTVFSGGTPSGFNYGNFDLIADVRWESHDGPQLPWCGWGNRYICRPSLAFGDGTTTCEGQSNLDYLYVVYTQFGSTDPLDMQDISAAGYLNGNIWLAVSGDGGAGWSEGRCITTESGRIADTPTRSPDCDVTTGDTCLSEHWPSVASVVNDTLHVFYMGDTEAGSAIMGEGAWSVSPMMYRPVFGGTDGALCPNLCDCFVWGDFNLDGHVDPLDVAYVVKCVFMTCPFELNPHPNCPWMVMDVNCDGSRDPLDVTCYVNYVYKGRPWVLVNCTDADGDPSTTDDIGCQ